MRKVIKGKVADIFADDDDEEDHQEKPNLVEKKVEIKVRNLFNLSNLINRNAQNVLFKFELFRLKIIELRLRG